MRSHYAIGAIYFFCGAYERTWTFKSSAYQAGAFTKFSYISILIIFDALIGIEPIVPESKSGVFTVILQGNLFEQLVRIELTFQAWKARVITHYTIAACRSGSRIRTRVIRLMRPSWEPSPVHPAMCFFWWSYRDSNSGLNIANVTCSPTIP